MLEAEMKLIQHPRIRNEYFGKLDIINDSFSEENIHVSKQLHCLENENYIDLQGIAGSIPEKFFMNKQAYSENENGSVSRSMQEDEFLMDV